MQPNRPPSIQRPRRECSRNFVPYGTVPSSTYQGPRTRSRSRNLNLSTEGPRTRSRSRELDNSYGNSNQQQWQKRTNRTSDASNFISTGAVPLTNSSRARSRSRDKNNSNERFIHQQQSIARQNSYSRNRRNYIASYKTAPHPSSGIRRSVQLPRIQSRSQTPEMNDLHQNFYYPGQQHNGTPLSSNSNTAPSKHSTRKNFQNITSRNNSPAQPPKNDAYFLSQIPDNNFFNPFRYINHNSNASRSFEQQNQSAAKTAEMEIITLSSDDENEDAANIPSSPPRVFSPPPAISRKVCVGVSLTNLYENDIFIPNIFNTPKNNNGLEAYSFISSAVRRYNTKRNTENDGQQQN